MRKWNLTLGLILAGVIVFVGCGKKAPVDGDLVDGTGADTPVETPADSGGPVGDPSGGDGTDVDRPAVPEPLALRDISFEFDQAELQDAARRVLDDNVRQLAAHPSARLVVEGHCDERGTVEYNLALGQRRAYATMQYMIRKGLEPRRLSIVSYGEERPIDPRHSEDAWSKNRRAHFKVQG